MLAGSLLSPSIPSASARRRAGSIVTTTARRPCCAACIASTAAVVVLPTPPDPQHTTTWLPATTDSSVSALMPAARCSCVALYSCDRAPGAQTFDAPEQRLGQGVEAVAPQVGHEQVGQQQLR